MKIILTIFISFAATWLFLTKKDQNTTKLTSPHHLEHWELISNKNIRNNQFKIYASPLTLDQEINSITKHFQQHDYRISSSQKENKALVHVRGANQICIISLEESDSQTLITYIEHHSKGKEYER